MCNAQCVRIKCETAVSFEFRRFYPFALGGRELSYPNSNRSLVAVFVAPRLGRGAYIESTTERDSVILLHKIHDDILWRLRETERI